MSYRFRPVVVADLAMLRLWLREPHVTQWWGDPDREIALISGEIEHSTGADLNIVELAGTAFAYAQSWDVVEEPALADQPAGTRGVDGFIGRPDMLGRGHGHGMFAAYAACLFAQGVPRLVTNPAARNAVGTRAYLRAGFRPAGERLFVDGRAPLLVMDAP